MNIFTYGSLMYSEVWQYVVNGLYASQKATISGYKRVAVRDENYPMLIPDNSQGEVAGVLYMQVSEQDIENLDAFEGAQYDRISTQVNIDASHIEIAEVYIANAVGLELALEQAWDQTRFETFGLAQFCENYLGYSRLT